MRASYALFAVAFGLTPLLGTATAHAHVDMVSPTPRQAGEAGGNQLKSKPCGQTTNKRTTDKVTTYTPGQKVEIKMKEYINHPGYFAVAFDPDGDDNFPFPIANMDKVVAATDDPKTTFPIGATVLGLRTDKDKDCYSETNHECTLSITIPNMTCQNCTLQLIQFMYDKLGNNNDDEYYYQCADIKIEGTPAGGAGGGGAGGAAGAAGAGTGGASAGTGTGGASAGTAAGGTTSAGTTSTAGTATTAGTTSTAGTATTPTAGTTGTTGNSAAEDDGGCGIAKHSSGGASLVAALGLMYALVRRRRAS